MDKLFSMEGNLLNKMEKIADMVLLNVLWIICCIPILTAGSATTALYSVMLKMVKDEESYIVRSFFYAFKENFKQSTIIWMLFLGALGLISVDFYFWNLKIGMGKIIIIPFAIILFLAVITLQYTSPILAFFENSTSKVLKNAFLMATSYIPYTILILAVNLSPWILLLFSNLMISSFWNLVIGFSFSAWINAHIFRKIFEKHRG